MKLRLALIILPMFAGLQACTLDGSSTGAGDVVIGGAVDQCGSSCYEPSPSYPNYNPQPNYPSYDPRPSYPSYPSYNPQPSYPSRPNYQPSPPSYQPYPNTPHGTDVSSPFDPRRDHEIPGGTRGPIPGGGPRFAAAIDMKLAVKKVSREALALSAKYGMSKDGSQKIVEAFKQLKAGSADGFGALGMSDDDMSSVANGEMPSNEGVVKASAKLGSKTSSVEKLMKDVVKQIQFQNEVDWMNKTTAGASN